MIPDSKHIKHLVGFYTAQKRKFFIWYFFSKCEQIRRQEAPDLIKFTEEIFNGKLIVCTVLGLILVSWLLVSQRLEEN